MYSKLPQDRNCLYFLSFIKKNKTKKQIYRFIAVPRSLSENQTILKNWKNIYSKSGFLLVKTYKLVN